MRELPGANNRSKQDDAFLISDLVATLYEKEGPSTIVLVAGDADYGPPLKKAIEKGWRVEVAFIARGVSTALTPFVHEFRTINPVDVQHLGHGYRG
ncbi:MAG: NYN domain-containing protein [Phycisphaerae bacterium]